MHVNQNSFWFFCKFFKISSPLLLSSDHSRVTSLKDGFSGGANSNTDSSPTSSYPFPLPKILGKICHSYGKLHSFIPANVEVRQTSTKTKPPIVPVAFNFSQTFLRAAWSNACGVQQVFYNIKLSTVNIYLLKVNNRNTRKRCEICLKLTIKTAERRHWGCSGVFIVIAENISHLFLVFLLLTLTR